MEIPVQDSWQRLSIGVENIEGPMVVLLAVPDTSKPEHAHFTLSWKGVENLCNWLNRVLQRKVKER